MARAIGVGGELSKSQFSKRTHGNANVRVANCLWFKVACRAAGGAVPAASLSLGKVLPVIVSAGMKALVLFSFCWLRFFLSGDTLYTSQTLIWSFMDVSRLLIVMNRQ